MAHRLNTTFIWTVKERDPKTGLFVPVLTRKNIQTNYRLTAFAGAFQGTYTPPLYMVIDGFSPSLSSPSGTTLILSSATQPTLTTGTQLVLSIGTGNQEVVSYTGSPVQSGTLWTYTLTAAPNLTHTAGDICVRNPTASALHIPQPRASRMPNWLQYVLIVLGCIAVIVIVLHFLALLARIFSQPNDSAL